MTHGQIVICVALAAIVVGQETLSIGPIPITISRKPKFFDGWGWYRSNPGSAGMQMGERGRAYLVNTHAFPENTADYFPVAPLLGRTVSFDVDVSSHGCGHIYSRYTCRRCWRPRGTVHTATRTR